MAFTRPRSLRVFCRQTLPLMLRETGGRGMVEAVAEIVETDRWNSFDRFHDTTKTLVRRYEEAGAEVEVCPVQTGGRMGSGRWIIREAADVRGATVDVVGAGKATGARLQGESLARRAVDLGHPARGDEDRAGG